MKRTILGILIFICVLNAWWFAALPLGIIGCWFFSYYIEIVIAGIVYDSLFGMIPGMGVRGYFGTIVSVAFLIAVSALKKVARR